MRTLEQERAKHAWEVVNEIRKSDTGHFRSYVERLPASILVNGLGQALAAELAAAEFATAEKAGADKKSEKERRDREAHRRLYTALEKWIVEKRGIYRSEEGLMKGIVNGTQEQYILAQAEALAYLEWLKKFARAFLKKKEE
ncbi:MAG: type III-B CRISPR module-associated protein Cmr5 [Methanomicrobiales archaeon]|nr:type III-B CRISPR module-associated protein Cmr5 [Methanomicrobiales archaeon]MDI6876069.1 type III-B CRISPR module-associated protein Cmr5 [Methanomicrobiales archaeon]